MNACNRRSRISHLEDHPCMQRALPDKLYLEVHAQHVEALVIAAVQYEAQQYVFMQQMIQNLSLERAALHAKGDTRQAKPESICAACQDSSHSCHPARGTAVCVHAINDLESLTGKSRT